MKKATIRRSGQYWIIDRGEHKTSPCCETKAEAEQLLACAEKWDHKTVRACINGEHVVGRVVNTAVWHRDELVDMVAVRWKNSTYWLPATDCEEV